GVLTYALGGWAAPWGIEYRIDRISALMLVVVTTIGAVAIPYALKSIAHEIPNDRIYLFYAMYLLNLAGLSGIAVTGDVFNLFVFLEISSLSSYVMISLGYYRRALTAAYRYLIMGTLGATFYIIGVGMLYMMTGTLNMVDLATLIPAVQDTRTILVAMAFLTVGISLKIALFPLHLWMPNAYTFAPSMVTVFLASTGTKVAIYVLIRIYFTVFDRMVNFGTLPTLQILLGLSILAMLAGSAVAVFQANVKRMMAYSSVAQIGYMVLGISFASAMGLTGSILHVFNHALMKAALFMALGCIFFRTGSVKIHDMHGLGRAMPWTMAAFVIAGLSLIGVPLTVGFISKWYLVQAALEKGWWVVAVLIIFSSLLAVIYIWRVVEAAYLHPRPQGSAMISEAPMSMLVPMWGLASASVYFGVDATFTAKIASEAASTLMSVLR
ncbi:MAG: monovalent cation/H+ antiporter subunit D family protein, partial [Rhodospirillales bacterium]|nr:monovalent cation/H+ antiporter subunit D family protein [Rhodospirillales bacterium]